MGGKSKLIQTSVPVVSYKKEISKQKKHSHYSVTVFF